MSDGPEQPRKDASRRRRDIAEKRYDLVDDETPEAIDGQDDDGPAVTPYADVDADDGDSTD